MTTKDLKELPKKTKSLAADATKAAGKAGKQAGKQLGHASKKAGQKVVQVKVTPSFVQARRRRNKMLTAGVLTAVGLSVAAVAISAVALAKAGAHYQVVKNSRDWTRHEEEKENSAPYGPPRAGGAVK